MMAGVAVLVFVMVILTGLFAVRDVLKLEPAEVFR
jgi:ABC-type lipoprotein release transport system permease subunit